MNPKDNYQKWLNSPKVNEDTKSLLKMMDEETINDAFYQPLTFGTAGMRGLIGPGINRMNIYTVRKATFGFAQYLVEQYTDLSRGVAIAYDNRHYSKEFAIESAKVLANFNIPSYIFTDLRPTPELSYAVRHLDCIGGIMITASHNPKEYNGYKLYDHQGCQLVPELANKVVSYVNAVEDELSILTVDDEMFKQFVHWIDETIDQPYYRDVLSIQLNPSQNKENFKIVYSPEHGTGKKAVEEVLKQAGYQLHLVKSQSTPDPDFSQTRTPNPEEDGAYEKAIELASTLMAELVIVTDPDADRLGVAILHENKYHRLTGNQTGAILIHYLLSTLKERNQLQENSVIYNTIVTSDLGEAIAKQYGVSVEKTLTGFKFIGEKIANLENQQQHFVLGYEESYGYLIHPFVRDKDAIQSSLMICEMTLYYLSQGKTLIDQLNALFDEYGYFLEGLNSIVLDGIEGSRRIQRIIKTLQNEPIHMIANQRIIAYEDYMESKRYENNEVSILTLPKSEVLKYYLEDGSWIAVRPSGTEPKCKIYYNVKGQSSNEAKQRLKAYQLSMQEIVDQIK